MDQKIINFDNQSTTELDPKVASEMKRFIDFGESANPSSSHLLGKRAKNILNACRHNISSFIGAEDIELYFTYSATLAANMIINGVVNKCAKSKNKIVTSRLEHKAIINTLLSLEEVGYEIVYVENDIDGNIDLDSLNRLLNENTALVCIMHVNNEIGIINPIKEIANECQKLNVPFYCDGSQAVGKLEVNVKELGIDFYSFSSHKIYGPYGVAGIYIKEKSRGFINPIFYGSGQERGLMPGTENIRGIYAFSVACDVLREDINTTRINNSILSQLLVSELDKSGTRYFINGSLKNRISENLNICFEGVDSSTLLNKMQQFALSTGSACNSNFSEPSHVLIGIGLTPEQANSSIRISFSKFNNEQQVLLLANELVFQVNKIRKNKNYGCC